MAVIGEDKRGVHGFAEAIGANLEFLRCRARNVGVGDPGALCVETGFRRKSKSLKTPDDLARERQFAARSHFCTDHCVLSKPSQANARLRVTSLKAAPA